MKVIITKDSIELGQSAGMATANMLRKAIKENGQANIILATGASQFKTLNQLVTEKDIDWGKVTMFHLDEYIGLPETSPASFRKYLKERFLQKVPSLKEFYLINGENEPEIECNRLNDIISKKAIDVALVGIGENGHLAFNDPPADFETEVPFFVVNLDEQCRRQQYGEGWFATIDDVPRQAISMSIQQICKSKNIVCSVPDSRKARAVKDCLEGEVSNLFPASILQLHQKCTCFLDSASAKLLSTKYYSVEGIVS